MSKNLKKQWRVEYRLSRKDKWRKNGLCETRSLARYVAKIMRGPSMLADMHYEGGYGLGNTRVVKRLKGAK